MSLIAQEKRTYTATTGENLDISINGDLDEPAWQNAYWQDNFIQFDPQEGAPPAKQTEFAILYDESRIYVAFRAYDDPDSISLRMTRRDNLEGDLVGVAFDSYFDRRTHFMFVVSAAGVRSDNVTSNDGNNEDWTWDGIWTAKTSITSIGWTAEMEIPLTQLRFKESEEQIWGLQIFRSIFRKDELSTWQSMKRDVAGFTSQFGLLNGIRDIKPKNALSLTPYVVAQTERFEKEPDNPFRSSGKDNSFDAGLDAKIGLTNNLTMDVTVNPDFGQVEADPSQVNLTTHETFFQEKRPFFIEGKNIMSYSLSFGDGDLASNNLFYSRRIGRPPHAYADLESGEYADQPTFTRILGAAKITGKTPDGWSIGVLESVTGKENAQIDGINGERSQTVEPLTNYFVGRVQKDFNEGNTYIGGIFTGVNRSINDNHLEFLHKSAYTGGIDFDHKWKAKTWMLNGGVYFSRVAGTEEAILNTQTSYSRTFQRPDADYLTLDSTRTSLSGYGGKMAFGKIGGRFQAVAFVNWKSPGLEINDIGYTPEVDEILQIVWMGYRWYEPVSIFRSAGLNLNQWTAYDFGGTLTNVGGNINGNTQFTNFWRGFGSLNWDATGLSHNVLRGGPAMKLPGSTGFHMGVFSNPQKKFTYGADGGAFWSNDKGFSSRKSAEVEFGYRPFETLQMEISPAYSVSDNRLQYVTQRAYNGDTRYIMSKIDRKTVVMSFRLNYNITPDLTIQFWGQPFIATGEYSEFKYVTDSKADDVNNRFRIYDDNQISYQTENNTYLIDDNKDGTTDYGFDNPNFNVKEFLSNLVMRWEYKPGSTVYLVWTQSRSGFENIGRFDFNQDIKHLFDQHPNNVFLVKFSYRIGR